MKIKILFVVVFALALVGGNSFAAGPYSGAMYDPEKIDSAIPGWIGPDGLGKTDGNNSVNPIFVGWATGILDYSPSETVDSPYDDPSRALGPVCSKVVSLGDLSQDRIDAGDPRGEITLNFDYAIRNGSGADFAVFENAFISGMGSPPANVFAELGYVGVSTDATNFAYFASDSLTAGQVGPYGCIDSTDVYNLVGKHVNKEGDSWGTPFDLATLSDSALVLDGLVNLNEINYVRIVDIPGSGNFLDATGDPIYDAWLTYGTGGVDLDAIGVVNAVPEPATILLLISGLLGVAGFRKTSKKLKRV